MIVDWIYNKPTSLWEETIWASASTTQASVAHQDRTGALVDTVGTAWARWLPEFRNRAPLRPSRAARWTLSTDGHRLTLRNLEGRSSNHKSVPVCGTRRCARRINCSALRYGVCVIALPLFDSVKVKPPVATDAKARQVSFSEHPVNCGPMDVQVFGQFSDG
jgi:hypothetical protein